MVMNNIAQQDTLYLIVRKEVWDRIVSGDKVIEYREATEYWMKRILSRPYKYLRITNGYGNKSRPYRLYRYAGATRVMRDLNGVPIQHFSIPISESFIIDKRDYVVH